MATSRVDTQPTTPTAPATPPHGRITQQTTSAKCGTSQWAALLAGNSVVLLRPPKSNTAQETKNEETKLAE